MQGELLLQDTFQVWDPKSLIRKGRERHLFLFELSLVFSKEIKDSSGRIKYLYKSRLRVLYYTILYYTILYYTILYYSIPYHIIQYYTILYYTILYYTIEYNTI